MDKLEEKRLAEIYNISFQEMQEIRRNNFRLFFGLMGLITIMSGWIITQKEPLCIDKQITMSIGILILSVIFHVLSKKLEKYFRQTASIINKIDKIYGFFQKGKYLNNELLLPKEWESFGNKKWKEPLFIVTNLSTVIFTLFGIVMIWFC